MISEERLVELFTKQKYVPAQNYFELYNVIRLIEAHMKPKVILEIGTYRGGSLRYWREMIPNDGLVISLDLNDYGFIPELKADYANDKRIKFIVGDSLTSETFDLVKKELNGRELDILLIDGNHSYEYVSSDYDRYAPMVRVGGFIIVHDLHPRNVGVAKKWSEIKDNVNWKCHMEIFGGTDPFGVGILIKRR